MHPEYGQRFMRRRKEWFGCERFCRIFPGCLIIMLYLCYDLKKPVFTVSAC